MRPRHLYLLAVLLAAAGAGGTQIAQVIDGRSLGQTLGAFLVLWLVGAAVLVTAVALSLRRKNRLSGAPMRRRSVQRFWRIFREDYSERRSAGKAEARTRPVAVAEAGFWATFAVGLALNLAEAVIDPDGAAWMAVGIVGAVAWMAFAAWYGVEVLSRRTRHKAGRRP